MTEPTEQRQPKGAPRGQGSFCIPRAAINALLDAQANAYEICAYLTLARHTDESGRYTPASITAVNSSTGANKTKGGPVDRAIERLKTIRVRRVEKVSNGRVGRAHAMVDKVIDLGPILYDRETWETQTGESLPDGPHDRAAIRFVLPDFGEPLENRVWIGNNLVSGVKSFDKPLKALKNAGSEAARLLLTLYASNDMETWGGVRPIGEERGPWVRFEPVAEDVRLGGKARLVRAKKTGNVACIDSRIAKEDKAFWDALAALEDVGLIYEVVMALNRNAVKMKFASGNEYSGIHAEAEPMYELDACSRHGFKPEGEEGIGTITAKTAADWGHPVAVAGGNFDGTYAAIVPIGYQVMIIGVYRLRFRVANPRNAGVKGAWARIHANNREAFDFVQALRDAHKLPLLPAPWDAAKAARKAAAVLQRPAPEAATSTARDPWDEFA